MDRVVSLKTETADCQDCNADRPEAAKQPLLAHLLFLQSDLLDGAFGFVD